MWTQANWRLKPLMISKQTHFSFKVQVFPVCSPRTFLIIFLQDPSLIHPPLCTSNSTTFYNQETLFSFLLTNFILIFSVFIGVAVLPKTFLVFFYSFTVWKLEKWREFLFLGKYIIFFRAESIRMAPSHSHLCLCQFYIHEIY